MLISLTPVCDFPIEIISLIIDDKNDFELDSAFVLPAKARNTYAHYFPIEFKYDAKKLKNLKLKARIPGSTKIFEVEVSDLPSYKRDTNEYYIKTIDSPSNQLSQMNDSVSFFNSKEVVIETIYYLPDSNHTLKIFPGQQIHFLEYGKIVSHGKIEMYGGSEEGESITISSEKFAVDSDFMKQHIVLKDGKMTCVNVDFLSRRFSVFEKRKYVF
ncbi:MAG: hypothetical protein IPG07_14190 [Crocinitomicaceae bacterium]|nr:hypothetical protein [Crocinitomicaceae bacterium]